MRTALFLLLAGTILHAGAALADDWFTDDFNNGVIDPAHWNHGGQVSEQNGTLVLLRQAPVDSIATVSGYSGDYTVELDSRLDFIVWNDMFHGIAIMNRNGAGISFGYSMYGKLYLATSDGIQTNYYYGPDGSNQPGTWHHWKLNREGTHITVLVDGVTVFGPMGTVPDGSRVFMPGIYEDGDGGPHQGNTSSTIDNFTIAPLTSGMAGPNICQRSWGQIKNVYSR